MKTGFDAASLERRYAFLDECPEGFFYEAVALPVGTLPERVAGIRRWRDALLTGTLPPTGSWPSEEVAGPVRRALLEMGLIRFCKGQEELTDVLLKDILSTFVRQNEVLRFEIAQRLRELEELERARRTEGTTQKQKRKMKTPLPTLDQKTLRRLYEQAEGEIFQKDRVADAQLVSEWGERARAWASIAKVFGDLGAMLGRGWDLSIGVLRHVGWLDILRLQKFIKKLPQIHEIVQMLGRLHASDNSESTAVKIFQPTIRIEEERREVRTPHMPAETRGVERSGEISRMLPAEGVMLGHPKLRLLWHARRAERALLTYRVEGIDIETARLEKEGVEEIDGKRPRSERGPILAVIDTSGSMHGLPEQVAKALVLEAMRTAHSEKRKCFLYAYSGPSQVIEHELDLSPEGIGRFLEFLSNSFSGGTDIGVMNTVADHLQRNEWKIADVILVSDGEWHSSGEITARVQKAREDGTRFHGVQIGNISRTGLHTICDPVHIFSDWVELACGSIEE